MENLLVNLSGKVRRDTLQGREYLVAPITLIVPGVLNGNKGPILYTQEEISKDPGIWNGIPLVVQHPTVNGEPVSARSPGVLNTQGIGLVLSAEANGKLTAEGWFDIERTRLVDNQILVSLEQGQKIEISTGLYMDTDPAEEGATHNATPYELVARNFRPDHLAILPDRKGACSIDDGCGVNNQKGRTMDKEKLVSDLIANCDCWTNEDKETLNSFSEDKLKKLLEGAKQSKAREVVANAALEGFDDQQGNSHVYNQETGKWESKLKEPKKKEPEKEPVTNATPEPKTAEEWLKDAPEEIRSVVQNAARIQEEQRQELIEELVANVEDDKKEGAKKFYSTIKLNKLQEMKSFLPKKEEKKSPAVNYFAAVGATAKDVDNDDEEDFLESPVWNWKESE